MKKVLCFLLCFGLALQLAACAKGSESGGADGSGAGASGSYDIYVEPDADWTGPVLTIATVGLSNFEAVVSTFNREEDMGFKLRLVDYLTSGSSRESALARLNMDLASGNGPDLIAEGSRILTGFYIRISAHISSKPLQIR